MNPSLWQIVVASVLTLAIMYGVLAWNDYRFGVRMRRRSRIKGFGWSRWAEIGWNAEDRRSRP